jgi:type II secretory ATPase GspE/PulE/Tfp pilus assembly ATPase PilB-like protein
LFLVTGPTGSGKTTTLYAALQEIRTGSNNIMTCEDPVEYEVQGISQSQINEKIGLTFAAQLRAILRQDPDVILVGEIRDQETAETAIRASLTGHMVFSTLHCNDALAAIPRLLDVGIEPYLLSTSLVGVLAQRLVRKLCPHCRVKAKLNHRDQDLFSKYLGSDPPAEVSCAGKCDRCHNTGYRGRVAVTELMPVTEHVASLIAQQAHIEEYRAALADLGFRSLQQDALRRVANHETTLEEVRRVVAFDEIAATVQTVPLMPRQAA